MPEQNQQIVLVCSDRVSCSLAFVKSAKITPPKGVKTKPRCWQREASLGPVISVISIFHVPGKWKAAPRQMRAGGRRVQILCTRLRDFTQAGLAVCWPPLPSTIWEARRSYSPALRALRAGELCLSLVPSAGHAAEVRGRPVRDHLQHGAPRFGPAPGHQVHVRLSGRAGRPAPDPRRGRAPHLEEQLVPLCAGPPGLGGKRRLGWYLGTSVRVTVGAGGWTAHPSRRGQWPGIDGATE